MELVFSSGGSCGGGALLGECERKILSTDGLDAVDIASSPARGWSYMCIDDGVGAHMA